jgi:hypothetical protein
MSEIDRKELRKNIKMVKSKLVEIKAEKMKKLVVENRVKK